MKPLAAAAALLSTAGPALAHTGPGLHQSVLAGLSHPMLGADHLLAMVSIGLVAATRDGAARIALPAAFVASMGAGIVLAMAGVALPLVEPMILASVLVLGALLALSLRPPVLVGVALAGLFGLFHGAAHGAESGAVAILPFTVGVLVATALLHALGVALGTTLASFLGNRSAGLPLRLFGVGVSLGGLALALG